MFEFFGLTIAGQKKRRKMKEPKAEYFCSGNFLETSSAKFLKILWNSSGALLLVERIFKKNFWEKLLNYNINIQLPQTFSKLASTFSSEGTLLGSTCSWLTQKLVLVTYLKWSSVRRSIIAHIRDQLSQSFQKKSLTNIFCINTECFTY